MNNKALSTKANRAYKWSVITELLAKIITPVINMILARILAPEAFGVLATVTMVVSFAEILTENGFQKYLIQRQFDSPEQEREYMSVALWANLGLSLLIYGAVLLGNEPIASLAGNKGYGHVLVISGITIPINAVIGIQNCKIKKDLEFDKLFIVRTVAALTPLFITIPLALLGFDYWALIIGNIAGSVVRSVLLIIVGRFKPQFTFSKQKLAQMTKSGVWTLLDGLLFWGTSWIDVLLIGQFMNNYYMGLYKNSVSVVTSLFSIITSAIAPVLFSTLSKLQDDNEEAKLTFLRVQQMISVLLIPLSIGLFIYRNFATEILFGSAWAEAANIVGAIGLATALRTVYVTIYSELYRSKGFFKISPLLQVFDIVLLIPTCILAVQKGFWALVYVRATMKLVAIIPELIVAKYTCKISPWESLKMTAPSFLAATVMGGVAIALRTVSESFAWNCISILVCIVVYFLTICIFKNERAIVLNFVSKAFSTIKKKGGGYSNGSI